MTHPNHPCESTECCAQRLAYQVVEDNSMRLPWLLYADIFFYSQTFFSSCRYHFSYLNPFNFIGLRLLMYFFGISDHFYQNVVVPMYASSFLTIDMSFVPAVVLPTIDDMISLQLDRSPRMQTWQTGSHDVFSRMVAVPGITVRLGEAVVSVRRATSNGDDNSLVVNGRASATFSRVVFACSAPAAFSSLFESSSLSSSAATASASDSSLLRALVGGVTYAEGRDRTMMVGKLHRDCAVLPAEHVRVVREKYANFVDVKREGKLLYYHNTFVLSSWLPVVREAEQKLAMKHGDFDPMFITYFSDEHPAPDFEPMPSVAAPSSSSSSSSSSSVHVDNRLHHPSLSVRNSTIGLLLRLENGVGGLYFCGSAFSPANGHDISLLSGFAVAESIGAAFPNGNDEAAKRDFNRLKRYMGFE